MAIIPMNHIATSVLHNKLISSGATRKKFNLVADARIKSETNNIGIGPIIFMFSEDIARQTVNQFSKFMVMCLFFNDESKAENQPFASIGILEDMDIIDMGDTINDLRASHGADTATMRSLAPEALMSIITVDIDNRHYF